MAKVAGGISVHAVDVAAGLPAAGLRVGLWRITENGREVIAEGACSAAGVLDHPVAHGTGVTAGIYEADFHIAEFYRAKGAKLPDPAFLDVATYRFGIAAAEQHFHLPLKFTAWGYSLFRGGL